MRLAVLQAGDRSLGKRCGMCDQLVNFFGVVARLGAADHLVAIRAAEAGEFELRDAVGAVAAVYISLESVKDLQVLVGDRAHHDIVGGERLAVAAQADHTVVVEIVIEYAHEVVVEIDRDAIPGDNHFDAVIHAHFKLMGNGLQLVPAVCAVAQNHTAGTALADTDIITVVIVAAVFTDIGHAVHQADVVASRALQVQGDLRDIVGPIFAARYRFHVGGCGKGELATCEIHAGLIAAQSPLRRGGCGVFKVVRKVGDFGYDRFFFILEQSELVRRQVAHLKGGGIERLVPRAQADRAARIGGVLKAVALHAVHKDDKFAALGEHLEVVHLAGLVADVRHAGDAAPGVVALAHNQAILARLGVVTDTGVVALVGVAVGVGHVVAAEHDAEVVDRVRGAGDLRLSRKVGQGIRLGQNFEVLAGADGHLAHFKRNCVVGVVQLPFRCACSRVAEIILEDCGVLAE